MSLRRTWEPRQQAKQKKDKRNRKKFCSDINDLICLLSGTSRVLCWHHGHICGLTKTTVYDVLTLMWCHAKKVAPCFERILAAVQPNSHRQWQRYEVPTKNLHCAIPLLASEDLNRSVTLLKLILPVQNQIDNRLLVTEERVPVGSNEPWLLPPKIDFLVNPCSCEKLVWKDLPTAKRTSYESSCPLPDHPHVPVDFFIF